jgi:serine/threonine protein kinase
MWSLGVVVYFCLTGYSPFTNNNNNMDGHDYDSDDKSALLAKIQRAEYTFPPHFSRRAKQFITNCLQLDPTIRMSASEALKHLWLVDSYQLQHQPLSRRKESRIINSFFLRCDWDIRGNLHYSFVDGRVNGINTKKAPAHGRE